MSTQQWVAGEITEVEGHAPLSRSASSSSLLVKVVYQYGTAAADGQIKAREKRLELGPSGTHQLRLASVKLDSTNAIKLLTRAVLVALAPTAHGSGGEAQPPPPPQQQSDEDWLPGVGTRLSIDLGEHVMGRADLGGTLELPPRPLDCAAPHAEHMSFDTLFSALNVSGVLAVFAALIMEQRLGESSKPLQVARAHTILLD